MLVCGLAAYAGADETPTDTPPVSDPTPVSGTEPAEQGPPVAAGDGRNELYALAVTYRDLIDSYEYRNGDWAVRVAGRWFAWANGRMLPEERSSEWREFQSYRFYRYPLALPPLVELSNDEGAALAERVRDTDAHPPERSEEFLETLLSSSTRAETERRLHVVEFLGFRFRMHEITTAAIARVEEDLVRLFETDEEAKRFFDTIDDVGGYAFRTIAGQLSRSYHSYGLAIDFIPASYDGKFPYWRWAYDAGIERWWELGYDQRWMVPLSVVDVFERHGFIWGGKWLYFDTIHFEYRPEVLLLARLTELASRLTELASSPLSGRF